MSINMILQRNNELMMYMLYVCLKEPNFRQNTFKIDRKAYWREIWLVYYSKWTFTFTTRFRQERSIYLMSECSCICHWHYWCLQVVRFAVWGGRWVSEVHWIEIDYLLIELAYFDVGGMASQKFVKLIACWWGRIMLLLLGLYHPIIVINFLNTTYVTNLSDKLCLGNFWQWYFLAH